MEIKKFITKKDGKMLYDKSFVFYNRSDDVIINKPFNSGYYFERDLVMIASQFLKPDDVVVDIGTNIGTVSIPLSKSVNKGTVYSFEINPPTINLLEQNILANKCKNIKIVNMAASHSNDVIYIQPEKKLPKYFNNGKGSNPGSVSTGKKVKGAIPVKSITIDKFIRDRNIKKVNLIKIDVEGGEMLVFHGAMNTIKKFKPIIIFEKNQQELENPTTEMENIIQYYNCIFEDLYKLGYKYTVKVNKDNFMILTDGHKIINKDNRIKFTTLIDYNKLISYNNFSKLCLDTLKKKYKVYNAIINFNIIRGSRKKI